MSKDRVNKPIILQVLPELGQGGVELGTIQIAEALKDKGIENYVASAGGRLEYQLERLGIEHIKLPLKSKNPFTIIKNSYRLAEIIKKKHINIIHARSRAPAWSAYLAAKKTDIHFITTFHGTYGLGPCKIKKIYNKIMTLGEKVIVISSHIKKHIMETYQVPENKIEFIHRCVDIEKFNPNIITAERLKSTIEQYDLPTDKKIILLIGRLTRWKGQELLIDALAKLKERNDFHCILTGDDQGRTKYTKGLIDKIKQYQMNNYYTFIRHTDDVPALMKACDIIISASLDPEAFGRIAAEGEAMGKLVIASNIGGSLDNIKDGITGRHFIAGDATDLANKIEWALDLSEAEQQKISQAAQNFIKENFTKQIMCDKTLKVYHQLINDNITN
ncbi:MAG: glycosyltransferase family 4 protein [Alphaproteobacteria bacterium]|nr:glycosyltransferase family 4 protein [Alphaproteobacteria bacterium]